MKQFIYFKLGESLGDNFIRVKNMECLFCKKNDNTFNSVEHIIPESLGNKEYILPKGIVCDHCNNKVLALLEQYLIEFDPFSLFTTFNFVKNKNDKLITKNFNNLVLEPKENQTIILKNISDKYLKYKNNGFNFTTISKRKMTIDFVRIILRAFYKIALEFLCFDHGYKIAFDNRYNELRDIILGKIDFHGYLLFNKNATPHNGFKVKYSFNNINNETITIFILDVGGVIFTFDLEYREL